MAANLFIIEAPGKCKALTTALRSAGVRDVHVLATIGHIGTNPQSFKPIAVDSRYRELAYRLRPDRESIAVQIERAAGEAKRIYIASDDDQEGDVIARDVLRWCIAPEDIQKVQRLRLKSLAPSEIKEALATAAAFDELAAARGDARRVIDRLVGSLSGDEGAVGRVQGSLLLALSNQVPVVGVATYTAPSTDGRGDWVATRPLFADQEVEGDFRIDVCLEVGAVRPGTVSNRAFNHDEILLSASLETDRSVAEVADVMQDLYERGSMTYPRAHDCTVTPEAVRRVTAIARANGAGFDPTQFLPVRSLRGEYAHEAPNPMVIGLPLNRDLSMLSFDDQVLVLIARRLVECGVACEIQAPKAAEVAAMPGHARGLVWRRVDMRGATLWRDTNEAGVKRWTQEQSLLHFMNRNRLGRPSTIVNHIDKFLSRNLITQNFDLTKKGSEWSANLGRLFGHQNISEKIEKYIADNKKEPSLMVADMMEICGLTSISTDQNQKVNNDEDNEISAGYFS